MPEDQVQDPGPKASKPIPKFEDFADPQKPVPAATKAIPKFEDFADTPKKKDTGAPSQPPAGSTGIGSGQPSQSTSPSPLPSPVQNKYSFDKFDVNSIVTNPTPQALDPVEQKTYASQLPGIVSPDKATAVVKSIIEQRKNPAARLTNAQSFLSDDLDQHPQLLGDVPHPELYKQQVIQGDGADSNINVNRYYQQRSSQLDGQIQSLKDQLYVSDTPTAFSYGAATVKKSPDFDAIQAKIDDLSKYKNSLNQYTSVLTAYQAVSQIPMPDSKDLSAMKDYNRKIGLKVKAVNEPIAAELKQRNIEADTDAGRHPEIVDRENYQLESEGLSARQFAITADFNAGKLSAADYTAKSNDITNQTNQLFDLHPYAKKAAQAQALGQVIQKQRELRNLAGAAGSLNGINPGSLWQNIVSYNISEDDIRNAAKDPSLNFSEADIQNQINHKDDIPGTSLLANVYNKFVVQSGENLIAPITSLITKGRLRTDAEVEAEKYQKDQAFQFNAAQQPNQPDAITDTNKTIVQNGKTVANPNYLQEVANPDAGSHNWGYGTLNNFGDAFGTLGQLWLASELTGQLGDAALGGTIGADTVVAEKAGTGLQQVGAFSAQQKNLFGNVAGMMLTGYNDAKANAKQFIGDAQGGEASQNLYALTRTMETGLLFGMGFSPQKLFANALGKTEEAATQKSFFDLVSKDGIDGVGKKEWSSYLKDNLIARVGIEGLQENTKASTMMAIDQAVGVATQAMFNPQSVDAKNLGHDLLNTGIHNFLSFAPISFFGAAAGSLRNPHLDQSKLEQEAIYRMGLDPVQYADYANSQVAAGNMLQADADKRIQLVNSMGKIHGDGDIPPELSRSEKIEFGNNLLHEKKMYEDMKTLSSKPLIDLKEKQIKALQERQNEIITNSTGIEKDENGRPIITSSQNNPNETTTTDNTNPASEVAKGTTAEGAPADSNNSQAQTTQNLITAREIIGKGETKGYSKDILEQAAAKPDGAELTTFLSNIADQAHDPLSEKNTVDTYGKDLVDLSKEMFPKQDLSLQPNKNENQINAEATGSNLQAANDQTGALQTEGGNTQNEGASPVSTDASVSFKQGAEASNTPPPDPPGDVVVTRSGLTEPERQAQIEQRKKETATGEQVKATNAVLALAKQFNDLPNGHLGKNKTEGLALLNKIRLEARKLNFTFDPRSGDIKNEKGRKLNTNYSDVGDRVIDEKGVVLRDRDPETQHVFDQLVEAGAFPNAYRLDGKKMSVGELDSTVEDVLNGIPSERANRYLDSIEESAKSGYFDFGEKNDRTGRTLDEVLGTEKDIQTEPMTEHAVTDWLNGEANLTPEQETILHDNFENLINEYEHEHEQPADSKESVPEPAASSPAADSTPPEQNTKDKAVSGTDGTSDTSAGKSEPGRRSDRIKDYNQPGDLKGFPPDTIMHFNQGMDKNRVTLIVDPSVKSAYSVKLFDAKKIGGANAGIKHILKDVAKEFRDTHGNDKIVDLRGIDLDQPLSKIMENLQPPEKKEPALKENTQPKTEPKAEPKASGAKLTVENFDEQTKPVSDNSGVRELNETGIKNEQTLIERQNRKLPEVEVELRRTFGEVFDAGKKAVDDGKIDPRLLAKELAKKPRALNAEESVALIYDRMRLMNEHEKIMHDIISARDENNEVKQVLLQDKMNQVEDDMLENDKASRLTGYEQGLGLAARRMMIKEDYSLANQKLRYRVANDGKELPKEVVEKLEAATKDLAEANKKLDDYEKQISELKAGKKVKETTDSTKRTKKSVDDFRSERQKLADAIAKKWKNAGNDNTLTAVPVPYAKQLAAIAPDVARMVKSYAEQGITELKEIIDDIHKNLQPFIPEITKKDVTDILAGQYDKEKGILIDRKKMEYQANVNKIKRQIDLEKEKLRLAKRPTAQKIADYFFKWRRFALLSGIKVLGKISIAAGARSFITSPIESVIGEGFRYIPGLKQLSEGAPREGGGFNVKAEAKALTQWVDKATYQDIREILTTGKSQLDYIYAGELHPPTEWLDFFGQLHSAIKTLPKRGEFFRAFELRAEFAAKQGKDLTDPFVQQEIGASAYNDALRAVFMQDNYITDSYRNMVNSLERSEISGSGVAANVLRFMFPIVKVPTNYVAEQTSYLVGGLKAGFALRKGVKDMTPDQKDFVIRALKKQAIGAAFMAIGFFNPQAVGGYFSGKRRNDDLASGDLVLYGEHLPHWMVHTPLLEALQVGATLRRAHDTKDRQGKPSNAFTGIPTVLQGVASQVPFFSQSSQISNAFASTDAFSKYLFRSGQSVVEPQLIKEIAEWTDTKDGQAIKRDPQTFLQQLKSGVPGLREETPVKKSKGKY